jgi:CRISP-associated protein Cas1
MIDHVLDLSQQAAYLSVDLDRLVVRRERAPVVKVPLEEVAVLIVSHPQVTYTQAVLAGLAAHGGMMICCDRQHMPVGMLMPMHGHFAQTPRFAQQADAPKPLRKQLWRQVVRAKLRAQAALLRDLHQHDGGLGGLVAQVKSDDATNVEAHGSRIYWQHLFGEQQFRRQRDGEPPNGLLNYGYAVLRAVVARALCATGLHPSLGLHHHNQYNAFNLADDLMEPLRPLIDRTVYHLVAKHGTTLNVNPTTKPALIRAATGRYLAEHENRTTFDLAAKTAQSLVKVLEKRAGKLYLPQLTPAPVEEPADDATDEEEPDLD